MNRFKHLIKAAAAIALTYVLCASALLQPMAVYAATLQAQQPAAEVADASSAQDSSAGDVSDDTTDGVSKDAGSAGAAQDGATPADAADEDEKADGEDAAAPESLDTEDEQTADDAVIGDSEANSWRYQNGELRSDLQDDNATDLGIESRSMHEMPEGATMQGIDVSGYQKDIDWQKVKDAGIDFAILKIGNINAREADGWYTDSYFQRNVTECERLGIPYGVYTYSYAKNADDAVKGADHIIALLKGHNPTLPVYLDLEDDSIKDTDHAAIAKAFCSTISAAGYAPGIYASASWFKNILTDPCFSNSGWGIWTAQYWYGQRYDASLGLGPEHPAKFDCWQYTSSGSVAGISGRVDLNYYYGNYVRDPSAPANVSAEPSGDGEVLVSWGAVPGAESYAIAERLPGGAFRTFAYDCLGTSYTVSDLANGVEHAFLVQARVGGRWSSFSSADLVRATPSGTVRPGAAVVDPLDSSAELSWGAVPGAESYAVATRTGGGAWVTHTYDCRGTSYTVRGLDNGRSYEFLVQARVGGRWSSFSESDITRALVRDPSAPANVSAEPSGDGEVLVSWGAVPGAESYAIAERLPGGAFRTFAYDCLGTSYTVSDLANGVEHAFLVQARVGGRWSSFSSADLVRATPSGTVRPGAAVVDPLDSSAELSWGAVPGAESYAVATRTGGGAWVTHTYDCRGTSYTVRGLDNGRSYEFLVQARVGGRWSSFSESDITRALVRDPSAPANVSAEPSGDGEVLVSWGAVPGAESYAIAERLPGGAFRTFAYDCLGTSYTVSDLANGVEHAFLVQARVGGRWSSFSSADLVRATPSGTVRPGAAVVDPLDSSAELSWGAVPGAESYAVATRTGGGAWVTHTYDCRGTSYTVRGLDNGRSYEFLVQARVGGRWSSFSESDITRAIPTDGISPDPEVTPSGDGVLTLTWDPIPGATSYAIAEWKNGKYYTYSLDCVSTSYTVENLSNGRDHYFLVQAYVNGRWSSSSPALRVVGRPVGTMKPTVSASAGYQSAYLSWNAVPGASRYAIAIRDSKGSYKTLTYNCASTSYTAIDLPGGSPCTLLVQAYCDGQWSQFSEGDHVKITPEGPAYLEYLGFQNPSRYFQVSSHSVTIKNQGFSLFGYRTESRIPRRATRDDCVNAMIGRAYEYIGTPYKWDYSCAPGIGVDCAGLVMQCLYATGMDLSPMNPWDHYYTLGHDQYANLMWNCGKFKQVPFSERQRGDLISYPGHIAIYLGNDRIIEAAGPGLGVREHSVYIGSRIRGVLRPFV